MIYKGAETVKIRINLLKEMHRYIINMNDESIYKAWTSLGVPDCPQEDEYEFIATHSGLWYEVVSIFKTLTIRDIMENY